LAQQHLVGEEVLELGEGIRCTEQGRNYPRVEYMPVQVLACRCLGVDVGLAVIFGNGIPPPANLPTSEKNLVAVRQAFPTTILLTESRLLLCRLLYLQPDIKIHQFDQ